MLAFDGSTRAVPRFDGSVRAGAPGPAGFLDHLLDRVLDPEAQQGAGLRVRGRVVHRWPREPDVDVVEPGRAGQRGDQHVEVDRVVRAAPEDITVEIGAPG